jgi:phosphatidylglycerophosphate synthase
MTEELSSRRPLKSRDTRWAAAAARFLAGMGLRPNQISVLSVFFAAIAGAALWSVPQFEARWQPWLLLAAAVNVQCRLLCNLFDGMVAIEGGFKTKSGDIYNELPDRFADVFIMVGAGYASTEVFWSPLAGWLAAVLALMTAYVRALGAATGAGQHFCGPMAKPQRMAAITIACLVEAISLWVDRAIHVLPWCLVVVIVGCLITVMRRCSRIVRALETK